MSALARGLRNPFRTRVCTAVGCCYSPSPLTGLILAELLNAAPLSFPIEPFLLSRLASDGSGREQQRSLDPTMLAAGKF